MKLGELEKRHLINQNRDQAKLNTYLEPKILVLPKPYIVKDEPEEIPINTTKDILKVEL